jgi:hypothetical protein
MNIYKQQGAYDCLLACLATATQKPYDELWDEAYRLYIEGAKGCYGDNIDRAFEIAGLRRHTDYWQVYIPETWAVNPSLRMLLKGRRALLQVPSLNYPDAQHLVYWSGEALHDPSNKQVYQWLSQCAPAYIWIFNEVSA